MLMHLNFVQRVKKQHPDDNETVWNANTNKTIAAVISNLTKPDSVSCPLVVAEDNKRNVVKVASGSKAKKHRGRKRKAPAAVTLESVFYRYAHRKFTPSKQIRARVERVSAERGFGIARLQNVMK
jgi:hypothetical protein